MKKLYRFDFDCGRMGDLEGIFVADDADVAAAIGQELRFGEVLGKHSDIQGTLDEGEVTILTDDAKAIEVIEKHLNGGTGFNPLHYLVLPCGCMEDDCCDCESG